MSSTRLDYKVDAIRERITTRRDDTIQEAQAALDAKTVLLPQKREDWRKSAIAQLRRVVKNHADMSDDELKASIRLPKYPEGPRESWGEITDPREAFVEAKRKADETYDRKVGRLEALRPIEVDGVQYLSMTPTMLRDWFGL